MGAVKSSLTIHKAGSSQQYQLLQGGARKRQRTSASFWDDIPGIIPNLPDEISLQILARLPRIYYLNAKSVSRSWKAAILSLELYKLRKELGVTEEWLYILSKGDGDNLRLDALDPVSRKWLRLPPLPNFGIHDGSKRSFNGLTLWNLVRAWLRRKDALDELPFCGCAIGAVDGCLYVLGGFCRADTVSCVCQYDPIANAWSEVSPMSIGRAYCKTGVLNNRLYVVGGVTRDRGALTPLQSAEVFDPHTGLWSEVASMPFSKAQLLPAFFLADLLKPIATGMTSYRGKLYVPQSLYCWPFFVDVGGEVYDPETNSWDDMPTGMGQGWPARQAGTKLSVIVDGELYSIDPSSSLDSARIKVYDRRDDLWKVIEGEVRIHIHDLTDAESPYLLAGVLGKLHVITKDGNQNILVMQADRRNQLVSYSTTSTFATSVVPETYVWNVLATRSVGSAELVSCQALDI